MRGKRGGGEERGDGGIARMEGGEGERREGMEG